jgi:hypothetical protein
MALDATTTSTAQMVRDLVKALETLEKQLDSGDMDGVRFTLKTINLSLDVTNLAALKDQAISRRRFPGT